MLLELLPAEDVTWVGVDGEVSVVTCGLVEASVWSAVTAVGEVWGAASVLTAERSFLRGWFVLRGVWGLLVLSNEPVWDCDVRILLPVRVISAVSSRLVVSVPMVEADF